jgi:hypothetical protein
VHAGDAPEAVGDSAAGTPAQSPVGSLLGAYAERLTARASAPARDNALVGASRLCGEMMLSREGDTLVITAKRSPAFVTALNIIGVLVCALGGASALLFALPLLAPGALGGFIVRNLNVALGVTAVGFAMTVVADPLARAGRSVDLSVPRSEVRCDRKAKGSRRYVLRGPFGIDGKVCVLVLRAASDADSRILTEILA